MRRVSRCVRIAPGLLAAAPLAHAAAGNSAPSAEQRGAYLAAAGDCISCHTADGGKPFAGGYRLDTPFGFLLAPNITPDPDTGIGRWTADDFYRALNDGVNRHGQDMYPAMPYTFYTRVTRADSDAIFAYLRTVPAVRNPVDVNHLNFPFNQRWTMAGLVEGLAHCSACHSPRNVLGGIESRHQYTGAEIDGWFAPNLSSNLHVGLGSWTAQEIATYLKTGARPGTTTAVGPMAEVVHNSTSQLSDADLAAMGEYLKSLPPESPLRTARAVPTQSQTRGASLYMDHCSACHQAKGRGMQGIFPPLAGNGAVIAGDPGNVLQAILKGIPMQNGYVAMPSFAGQLDDQQVADVANYVRTSWGNTGVASATAADVAKLRAQAPR